MIRLLFRYFVTPKVFIFSIFLITVPTASSAIDPYMIISSDGRVIPFNMTQPFPQATHGSFGHGHSSWLKRSFPLPVSRHKEYVPQGIIGDDNRYPVKDETAYPHSAIVWITLDFSGSPFHCSGTLYGRNVVATAAHCVYNREPEVGPDGWGDHYVVIPGTDGTTTPYGTCGVIDKYVTSGWYNDHNRDFDFGALVLDCNIGDDAGWFGLYNWNGPYEGANIYLTGYPLEQPDRGQWEANGQLLAVYDQTFDYSVDTTTGQSGGPLWKHFAPCGEMEGEQIQCILAIHSFYGGSWNTGTRINRSVMRFFIQVSQTNHIYLPFIKLQSFSES